MQFKFISYPCSCVIIGTYIYIKIYIIIGTLLSVLVQHLGIPILDIYILHLVGEKKRPDFGECHIIPTVYIHHSSYVRPVG